MEFPITKKYLDKLRQNLIYLEDTDQDADYVRTEYRTACAAAYSTGKLVFKEE